MTFAQGRAPDLEQRPPKVAVVIVTWNKGDYVMRLLDSLSAHPYPNWEVFLVDNASEDDTLVRVRGAHPWVRIIANLVNLGGSGGFNTGLCAVLKRGGYDYVWLLDNDVEVCPGALEVLVETLEARPDAAVAGSHMLQLDNPGTTNEVGGFIKLGEARLEQQFYRDEAWRHASEIHDVDYVAACSLLVRFRALELVGIWDDFFIHYDDADWCLRMKEAGWRVLACDASRIRHMSANVKRVTWILYYDIRNILYLMHKHGRFGRFFFFLWLLRFALRSVRFELSGRSHYSDLTARGVEDFFDGRMGKREDLGFAAPAARDEVLERILHEGAGRVMVLEPISRPVFTEEQLAAAAAQAPRVLEAAVNEVAHEGERALPESCARVPLSRSRPLRILQSLWMMVFRRADYLIFDVDVQCGLLGLCARKTVMLVDDKCIESPGVGARLGRAFGWIARTARLFWNHYLPFARRFEERRGSAALTPEAFEAMLVSQGGSLTPDLMAPPIPSRSAP